jgi:hypothetical protein
MAGDGHPLQRPPANTPRLYAQDGLYYDAVVHAHYFIGGCDWLVTEYDPVIDEAFGWACLGDIHNAELGCTNLAELEAVSVRVPVHFLGSGQVGAFVQRVEYDRDWQPQTLRDAIAAICRNSGRPLPHALAECADRSGLTSPNRSEGPRRGLA